MSLSAQQPGEMHEEPLLGLAPAPARPGSDSDAAGKAPGSESADEDGGASRFLPGGRVVAVASVLVVVAAVAQVQLEQRIGAWAGITLIVVSIVAPLVTRSGDRSLPAMMPPLAFLTAVLIAGQDLLPASENSLLTREAVMIMQTLGPNALWVIVATLVSVTIATVGHLADRRAMKRRAATSTRQP